jgi:hypothetical protein
VSIPHRVEGGGFAANAGEFGSVPAFILKLHGLVKARCVWRAAGVLQVPSTKGAEHASPGQRPGFVRPK